MFIQIGTPACLPVGLTRVRHGETIKNCILGFSLQYPPTHAFVYKKEGLQITGARAQISRQYALQVLSAHQLEANIAIEIELATPAQMGLGSEAGLAYTTAQAIAWAYDLTDETSSGLVKSISQSPDQVLVYHAMSEGGVLMVETQPEGGGYPGIIRREEIQHDNKKDDWVLVYVLPRTPKDAPESWESQRARELLNASDQLDEKEILTATDRLWSALEKDDIAGFGQGIMDIRRLNDEGLKRAGNPHRISSDEGTILEFMREHGAAASWRSATGLALFGLIKGAVPSVNLRNALRNRLGPYGGVVSATLIDNQGIRTRVHEEDIIIRYYT